MTTAAFAMAMATYLSLHPACLLAPVGLLCYDQLCKQQIAEVGIGKVSNAKVTDPAPSKNASIDQRRLPNGKIFALQFLATFALASTFLLLLSRILLPSWSFIPSVYLTPLQLPDLTPNPGLWWYFFIEMFDPFRSFFLGVFGLHMLSYSVPFCLRLRKQPLAATVLMMGVIAIFEPYANVGDVGGWLSALCLLGHSFESAFLHPISRLWSAANFSNSLLNPPLHLSGPRCFALHFPARPGLPSPLDLRRLGKCQFLLRHYARVELGFAHLDDGHAVRGSAGRVGG